MPFHLATSYSSNRDDSPCTLPPPNKKSKGDSQVWSSINGFTLSLTPKNGILEGEKLDDLVIDTAQNLLKSQFPRLSGLQSTLLQSKQHRSLRSNDQLQVIHSRGDHWIVASTLSSEGVVNVYDSVYSNVNKETKAIICNLFGTQSSVRSVPIPRQMGGQDCGLYAIAIATALAFGEDPVAMKFRLVSLRSHLVECIATEKLSLFPIFE